MAQFDVPQRRSLVFDCKSNLHRDLPTRLVVSLIRSGEPSASGARLAPRFTIDGKDLIMSTQFAATVRLRVPGPVIASLAEESPRIPGATDAFVRAINAYN